VEKKRAREKPPKKNELFQEKCYVSLGIPTIATQKKMDVFISQPDISSTTLTYWVVLAKRHSVLDSGLLDGVEEACACCTH